MIEAGHPSKTKLQFPTKSKNGIKTADGTDEPNREREK